MLSKLLVSVLCPTLALALGAQEPAPAEPGTRPVDPQAQMLHRAMATMRGLTSVRFASDMIEQKVDGALGNAVFSTSGRDGNGSVEGVRGVWSPGMLAAETSEGDQLRCANGRMIARVEGADGDWVLRDRRLADGNPAPLVLDPGLLFTLLGEMSLEVAHSEVGARDDRPVQLLSVTLDKHQVAELDWAGMLPTNPDPLAGFDATVAFRAFGNGAPRREAPVAERLMDLVLILDPATGLVFELRARVHAEDGDHARQLRARLQAAGGGGIVIQGGAGAADDDDDDEEEAEDVPVEPTWSEGFPDRGAAFRKHRTSFEFRVEFEEHGAVQLPELSERARRLLGIR